MRKLAVLLLAACSNSPHTGIVLADAAPDTAIDTPLATNAVAIDVFGGSTALFAYRDGQGPWQSATPDAQGTYTIHVTNDYEVVIACVASGTSDVVTLGATYADGNQFVFCNPPPASAATQTVAITGHMVQAGTVSFGDSASSTTAPWDFSLNVTTGNHDLVATSTDNALVVRRDQPVTAAGALADVDTAQQGTPMVPVTLSVDGVGSGETVSNELDWFLTNDFVTWMKPSLMVETPPPALVAANDYEYLFVDASTAMRDHFASTQFTGSETTFTLLPLLDGVQFGVAHSTVYVTWGTLPDYDQIWLSVYGPNASEELHVTNSWVAATHATQLTFDAMPPGFDDTWQVDLHQPHINTFQVTATSGTTTLGTTVGEYVNGALRRDHERGLRGIPRILGLAHRRMDVARRLRDVKPRAEGDIRDDRR